MKGALICCACLALGGCLGPPPFPEHEPTHNRKVEVATAAYVVGLQDFTFDFAQRTGIFESEENELLSPFGMYQTLAMLYAGADGETFALLGDSLNAPDDDRETFLDAQRAILNQTFEAESIKSGNAAWIFSNIEPKQRYEDLIGGALGADVIPLGSPDDADLKEINRWVRQRSDDMIQKLLKRLPHDVLLLVTNVIALDAKWLHPFDPDKTHDAYFKAPSGTREVSFMGGEVESCWVYGDEQVAALRMDFDEELLSFVILLPAEDSSVAQVAENLDRARWNEIIQKMEPKQRFAVEIPRFKFRRRYDLTETIRRLSGQTLKLTGISEALDNAPLSLAMQETYIEVYEEGVRAAAASAIATASAVMTEFIANRPFLFFLVENETGIILMLGAVNEP